jgi:chemotaxis protein MotB
MRTYRILSVAGLLIAGLLSSVGCHSQEEFDQLKAQNARAIQQREESERDAAEARRLKKELEGQLAQANALLTAKDQQIANLEKSRSDLQSSFDALKAMYDKLKGAGPIVIEGNALPDEMNTALVALAAQYPGILTYDPKTGMVKLSSDLTFDPGNDEVQPAAREALKKLVEILNSPVAQKYNAYIAGHTDDLPIAKEQTKRRHPTNWYLSVHRAVAVQEVMTEAGLAAVRIGAMGFGEYHPIAPNAAGHKGNKVNRRVEIWIVPPSRFLTQAMGEGASTPPPAKSGGAGHTPAKAAPAKPAPTPSPAHTEDTVPL